MADEASAAPSKKAFRASLGALGKQEGQRGRDESSSRVEIEFLREFWDELAGGENEPVEQIIVHELLRELYNPGERD